MSDVVQWLNEIKELKQQAQDAKQSENSAHASADNWRKRYEIEAQQRRTDAEVLQHTIDDLRSQLAELKTLPDPMSDLVTAQSDIEAQVHHLSIEDLRAKLIEVWSERDRLAHDLKTEQTNHTQTRKNLTMALGDTIDMVKKLTTKDEG